MANIPLYDKSGQTEWSFASQLLSKGEKARLHSEMRAEYDKRRKELIKYACSLRANGVFSLPDWWLLFGKYPDVPKPAMAWVKNDVNETYWQKLDDLVNDEYRQFIYDRNNWEEADRQWNEEYNNYIVAIESYKASSWINRRLLNFPPNEPKRPSYRMSKEEMLVRYPVDMVEATSKTDRTRRVADNI